jgi:FkbM family methyltransferase
MESWLSRLQRLPLPATPVVVDGGANKGSVAARMLTVLPDCPGAAFQPQPRLARKLAKRFTDEPRVAVFAAALGERATPLPLTVLARPTLSSLLAPTGIRDKYAGENLPVTETVPVPVVRLDAVLPRADIIKLDVQGYELPALRGAAGLLPGVAAVVAETARYPLYAGQALLPELEVFLEGFGLRLDGVYDLARDPSGRIVSGDAVFVRKP